MAVTSTANTTVEVGYTTESDHTIGVTKEQKNTKLDSKTVYAHGTGTTQLTRIYSARRTLTASSGTDDINLSSLSDTIFGGTINFDKIKFIYIKNQEPVDSDGAHIRVGGLGTSAAWIGPFRTNADYVSVGPQSEFFISRPETGFDCPTSASTLRVTHDGGSSGTVEYDIIIGGTV